MISRRNYMAITVVMGIIFVLFQFSNVALELWNDYGRNPYADDTGSLICRTDAYSSENASEFDTDRKSVAFIGSGESAAGETVAYWAEYTKRHTAAYESMDAYDNYLADGGKAFDMIVIEASSFDTTLGKYWQEAGEDETDWNVLCESIFSYADAGSDIVFASLPSWTMIERFDVLQELLGIKNMRTESITVPEVRLYDGFLLGGGAFYAHDGDDTGLVFTMPWYEITRDGDVYMAGLPDMAKEEGEPDLPAVIWRAPYGSAGSGVSVFAVNGPYMYDSTGLGILAAIDGQSGTYGLYPVVNARTFVYADFPVFANENRSMLMQKYSQDLAGFELNALWPEVAATARDNGLTVTCMMAPELDYSDEIHADADRMVQYMKLMNESGAEAGISLWQASEIDVDDVVVSVEELLGSALPDYKFMAYYDGGLADSEISSLLLDGTISEARTFVHNYGTSKEPFGWMTEDTTRQDTLADCFSNEKKHGFASKCLETAFGYNSLIADMSEIFWPEDGVDGLDWAFASNRLRESMRYYGYDNDGFEKVSVSEADGRVRRFFATDFTSYRELGTIYIERNDTGADAWFVLRSGGESIARMTGGEYEQLEDGAYLIHMTDLAAEVLLLDVSK